MKGIADATMRAILPAVLVAGVALASAGEAPRAIDVAASWDTTLTGAAKETAAVHAKDKVLRIAGTRSRALLRFDLPRGLDAKKVYRAELRVFARSVKNLRHYMPIVCYPLTKTPADGWTIADADAARETTIDYKNGRPPGVMDSEELYGKKWQYWYPPPLRPTGVGAEGMWLTLNVTPAVAKWLADPKANHGLCLMSRPLDDRRMPNNAVLEIVSAEGDKDHRPVLNLRQAPSDNWPGYRIDFTHALQKFCDLSDRYKFRGRGATGATVHAARGEAEGFQALIVPETQDLKSVTFSWTDLSGPGGAKIPAGAIEAFAQPFISVRRNRVVNDYHCGRVVRIPDPLLPLEKIDCPRHQATPVLFRVTVPRDIPAGTYTGQVTCKPANAHPSRRKITVGVWDFDMPLPWNFKTMGQFVVHDVQGFYGRFTDPMWRWWYDFLLDHRFSPTEQYNEILSPRRDLAYCVKRGMNTIYVGSPNDTRRPLNMPSIIQRYEQVKKAGLLEQSLIYVGDESGDFAKMRKRANLVHAHCPGLRVMMGGSRPRKELIGTIDIWDPQIGGDPKGYGFHDKDVSLVAEAVKRGEEVYWYVAAGPDPPYPNVQMERVLAEARVFFWMSWGIGATGFEYYCYNIWKPNITRGKRWPAVPWNSRAWGGTNGDGMLFYPGPGGRPASSLRFETIRDGIEDWEMLYVLRDCRDALVRNKPDMKDLIARADAALNPKPTIYRSFTDFTFDPSVMLKRRRQAGDLITQIKAAVGEAACAKAAADRKSAERKRRQDMLRKRHLAARKALGLDKQAK